MRKERAEDAITAATWVWLPIKFPGKTTSVGALLFDASPPGPRDEASSLYRTGRKKSSRNSLPFLSLLQLDAPVLGIQRDRRVVALSRGQQRDEDDDGQGQTDGDEVGLLQAELHLEVLSLGKAIRSCF